MVIYLQRQDPQKQPERSLSVQSLPVRIVAALLTRFPWPRWVVEQDIRRADTIAPGW